MKNALLAAALLIPLAAHAQLKAASDTALTGFTHPESVGCDAKNKAIYVSEFAIGGRTAVLVPLGG